MYVESPVKLKQNVVFVPLRVLRSTAKYIAACQMQTTVPALCLCITAQQTRYIYLSAILMFAHRLPRLPNIKTTLGDDIKFVMSTKVLMQFVVFFIYCISYYLSLYLGLAILKCRFVWLKCARILAEEFVADWSSWLARHIYIRALTIATEFLEFASCVNSFTASILQRRINSESVVD